MGPLRTPSELSQNAATQPTEMGTFKMRPPSAPRQSTVTLRPGVAYQGLAADYAHNVIDHAECYVDGAVHTNGLGELLVAAEVMIKNIRQRRAVPLVPLS